VTVLSLSRAHPSDAVDVFDVIKDQTAHTITPDWCAGLRSRTVNLIPVIISNSSTFGRVIAEKFCDQRVGDQFGVLLAGAYSLASDKPITYDDAYTWIDAQDWTGQSAIEDQSDEIRCLNRILEHIMIYPVMNERIEQSIGEMLYHGPDSSGSEALERIGIKVQDHPDGKIIVISDSHAGIQKILKDTPWPNNWGRILKRLDGAFSKKSVRFSGLFHRATCLFKENIFSDEE
jgi:putative DNA primase/helicase